MRVKSYTVYRFDYARQVREPVGKLMERRRAERRNNAEDLLRLAQKIYSTSPLDSHIVISPDMDTGAWDRAGLPSGTPSSVMIRHAWKL